MSVRDNILVIPDERKKKSVVEEPKSHGPSAAWVIKEIGLGDRGDFANFAHLADAKRNLEVHQEGGAYLWCRCCGKKFGTRKNVWQAHFETQAHKEAAARPPCPWTSGNQFLSHGW